MVILYTFITCGRRNWSAKRKRPAYWSGPPPSLLVQMKIMTLVVDGLLLSFYLLLWVRNSVGSSVEEIWCAMPRLCVESGKESVAEDL